MSKKDSSAKSRQFDFSSHTCQVLDCCCITNNKAEVTLSVDKFGNKKVEEYTICKRHAKNKDLHPTDLKG